MCQKRVGETSNASKWSQTGMPDGKAVLVSLVSFWSCCCSAAPKRVDAAGSGILRVPEADMTGLAWSGQMHSCVLVV